MLNTRKQPPRPAKTVEHTRLAPRKIPRSNGLLDAALALPVAEPVQQRIPLADEKRHMDRVAALGSRGFERRYRMDEMDLLALVIAKTSQESP